MDDRSQRGYTEDNDYEFFAERTTIVYEVITGNGFAYRSHA